MRHRSITSALAAGAGLLAAFAAAPGVAQAAPAFTCEGSALRGTILGQTIEPSVYGRGQECKTGQSIPTVSLPQLLTANVLVAAGSKTDDALKPAASSAAGLAGANLQLLPSIPLNLPIDQAIASANLTPIQVPLGVLGTTLGLPNGTLTVDVAAALKRIASPLPQTNILSAGVISSVAAASCDGTATAPKLAGGSTITGLSVLGQPVNVDSTLEQNLNVIDTQNLDPSALTIAQLNLGLPVLDQIQTTALQALLQPVLDAIPTIMVPPTVANVKLTANTQTKDATSLTQQALTAHISLLGMSIADLVIGEAKVSATGDCPKAAAAPAAEPAELQCTDRKLVLLDVFERKGRVLLHGAANKDFVGKAIDIKYRAGGNKVVAHATVDKDGFFTTTASLPTKALRTSNLSRYTAVRGSERSLPLKLSRRMRTSSVTSKGGLVTIRGRVSLPLAKPVQDIRLVRRVSCGKTTLVKRFKPKADGTFVVHTAATKNPAVYRAVTAVRKVTTNPKTYPTFTLPRGIDLSER